MFSNLLVVVDLPCPVEDTGANRVHDWYALPSIDEDILAVVCLVREIRQGQTSDSLFRCDDWNYGGFKIFP